MAESNVAMTRVDFRLVHGQVAARWTRTLAATKIIVIDDGTAKDPFMQKLFSMTAPAGSKIFVYTIKQAIEKWNKNKFGKGPIIVIFKDIASAKKAYDAGFQYESLNIGQVPKAEGRVQAYNTVCLSDEELEAASGGVKIYTKQENHWWGDNYIYLVCGSCGGADWTVTGWYDINKIYVTCNKCGRETIATIAT